MEKTDIFSRLRQFEKRNIHFWTENGKLKYRSGSGALTPEDMAFLKANKADIISVLESEAEIHENKVDEEHRYDPFPLTDVQQAYMLGRSAAFDYGGVACHIYMQFEYDQLDTAKVQRIWNKLIAHHDMLRVQIYPEGYQQVLKEAPEFHVDEYGAEDTEKIIADMSHRVYDTTKFPLFGVAVQKCGSKDLLHFSIEFLIADWTSIWMLLTKFESMYFDGDDQLQEVPVQFRDYVIAENKAREGAAYERDKAYWIGRAADFAEAPKLPVLPENKELKPEFERRNVSLSPEDWQTIKRKSAEKGVTPTAVILALYARVLAAYSSNKKFVLNLTVLNRLPLFEAVDRIIGDFTSVSLLEADMTSGSFTDQVRSVGERLFLDLDHRTFSGVEMIREITRIKGKDAAFMPYVFTSAIGLLQSIEKGGIRGFRNEGGISQTPQVLIDCQVMDGDFGFQANWDIRKNVFRSEVIEGMFGLFEAGLRYLVESDWDTMETSLPALQTEVIDKANDTAKPIKTCLLHAPIIEAAKQFPDKTAVIQGDSSFTYSQLMENAGRVLTALKENGCKRGDMIAVVMDKSIYQVSAVIAVLSLGGAYVPVQSTSPVKRLESILSQTNASAIITAGDHSFENAGLPVIHADKCACQQSEITAQGELSDIAYIIFTSGSTGEPKGVVITHHGASNTIEDINERMGITENDSAFGLSELHFDLSVYDIFGILAKGGTLVLPEGDRKRDPSYLADMTIKHGITVWNSVPAYMQMMMEYASTNEKLKFPSLRKIMLSGDFIPLDLPDMCLSRMENAEVYSLGGATEGSIWSIIYKYEGLRPEDKTILYGKPLANQEFRILDSCGRDVPMYVEGELYIVGDGVALGYLGDEEKTREHFSTDKKTGRPMYRTGDFGRYQSDGNIEFIGRKDDQVKIRGHRIELGEIEKALSSVDGAEQAAAIIDDSAKDKRIVGFMTTRKKSAEETAESRKNWEDLLSGCEDDAKELFAGVSGSSIKEALKLRDDAIAYDMAGALAEVPDKQIKEDCRWLADYWRKDLADRSTGDYSAEVSAQNWDRLLETCDETIASAAFLKYLRNSCASLPQLLTGEADPIKILYPDGDDSITTEMYVRNTMSRYLNRCICSIVKKKAAQGRKLRILEIGAGTGATSGQVLEAVKGMDVEYFFTDITPFFLTGAKKKFEEYTNVIYKLLNIDEPINDQGFAENYFDIIIAVGVLENAKDIRYSLSQVRKLSAIDGIFLFTEPVFEELWILASQAFLMTRPEDEIRRDEAFIKEQTWLKLLEETEPGADIRVIPENGGDLDPFGLKLFAMQLKGGSYRPEISQVKEQLKEHIPEYMLPYKFMFMESFPLTDNGKLDRKALKKQIIADDELALSHKEVTMTGLAADIQAIIEETGLGRLTPNDNFYDFGADSLIMAKLAGKIREKIVPDIAFDSLLRHLLNYPTISDMVEYIEAIHGKEQASSDKPEHDSDTNGVFTLYGGGEQRLRVLCHAATGTMNSFMQLIKNMSKDGKGQVLGITIKDADKYLAIPREELFEVLADDYTEQIIALGYDKVQMIGYCYAAWLSIEIGNRLIERGIDVEDLVLVDSHIVPFKIDNDFIMEILYISNIYVKTEQVGIDSQRLQDAVVYSVEQTGGIYPDFNDLLKKSGKFSDITSVIDELSTHTKEERFQMYVDLSNKNTGNDMDMRLAMSLFDVYVHSFMSINYVDHPYIGDVRYIRAREVVTMFYDKERTLAYWESLALGDFTVSEIDGNHYTCIEDPDHAVTLAKMIGEVFDDE